MKNDFDRAMTATKAIAPYVAEGEIIPPRTFVGLDLAREDDATVAAVAQDNGDGSFTILDVKVSGGKLPDLERV